MVAGTEPKHMTHTASSTLTVIAVDWFWPKFRLKIANLHCYSPLKSLVLHLPSTLGLSVSGEPQPEERDPEIELVLSESDSTALTLS